MSDTLELTAEARSEVGKGASRRLRRLADKVPAIIYGAGKDPENIMVEHRLILKALENEAFYSQLIDLKVDGKQTKVVLKDLQRHPYKPKVQHMDFYRISENEKISMKVPLHFVNSEKCPGVKAGGIVTHLMIDVEVSCLPTNLPEHIEVDLANLELDASIHLSEVTAPKGIEFPALAHGNDAALANIHAPRAVAAADSGDEAAADAGTEEKKD